jgi:hypothetical protein
MKFILFCSIHLSYAAVYVTVSTLPVHVDVLIKNIKIVVCCGGYGTEGKIDLRRHVAAECLAFLLLYSEA